MRSIWYGLSLEVSRKRESEFGSGCSITTTNGLTRGLEDYVLPIDFLRSRRS